MLNRMGDRTLPCGKPFFVPSATLIVQLHIYPPTLPRRFLELCCRVFVLGFYVTLGRKQHIGQRRLQR